MDYCAELEGNACVDWIRVYERALKLKREKAQKKKKEKAKKNFVKAYPCLSCLAGMRVD